LAGVQWKYCKKWAGLNCIFYTIEFIVNQGQSVGDPVGWVLCLGVITAIGFDSAPFVDF
jgi:hypothetical protein